MSGLKFLRHITRRGVVVLAGLAVLPALADAPASPDTLAQANTGFAFDLVKQLAARQPAGNIFISPYSVSSVLQLVGDGAAGATKTEMDQVLHLTGMTSPDEACKSLDASITREQKDVMLNLANSLWYQQGTALKPEFVARSRDFFRAKTGALDFARPQSAKIINDWAAKSTDGRIQDVVQWPINPHTRVILANAIYFKGRWAHEFDRRATKDRAFTLADGTQQPVPMMQQRRHFDYFQTPDFQAVRLPYAGGRLQMYLFLPATGSSLKQMLAGFDGGAWQTKILPQFRDRDGGVVLPRFKLHYAVTLNDPLAALGMKRAFSSDADFSAMSAAKLHISAVKQKSFVDVDEAGTEAAAVTTVTVRASLVMMPQRPFEMILDHPFFFVIGDEATHSILFMGIVSNPAGN